MAVDEIDIADSKAVRFFRIQAGMSQATLGGELGVTFQQIQKYEKGLDRHWLRSPAEIAKLFNRRVTAFYPKSTTDGTVNINEVIALTHRPQTMRTLYSKFRIPVRVASWQISPRCREDADARRVASDAKKRKSMRDI
jgi:transcriptional regulator with XRE-family HTH domain